MKGRKPKLTTADVRDIREMYANTSDPIGWTVTSIAKLMKVSTATIQKVLNSKYEPRAAEEGK